MRRLGVVVILLGLGSPFASAVEDDSLDGRPIVAIRFDRYDIFDTSQPQTSAWPYRWANALHITSTEPFLRSMLLFRVGDPYSANLAAESARILRGLGIMNPVEITAKRVEGGVEVTVETHDQWTLELAGQLGIMGSRTSFALSVAEENLLGWGKKVRIAFSEDNERTTWSYSYFDPNVLNSRWRVLLVHEDHSDGNLDAARIDRPFYSLETRWSWGVHGVRESLVDHLYSASESAVAGERRSEQLRIWGGGRLPGGRDVTRRLTGGWEHRRDRFSDWSWTASGDPYTTPENRIIEGPMLGYEQINDRFLVVQGFRGWTVQEDIALGPNFKIDTTLSDPRFGGDRPRLVVSAGLRGARRSGQWLFLGDAWVTGRLENGETENLVYGLMVGGGQLGRRGWQVRLLAENSLHLDRDRQLTLGADVGLRGWEPDSFDGTGRVVVNAQWRTLIKEKVLHLFSFGLVLFADGGATWAPRVGPSTKGVRFDTGVGLLFDLAPLGRTTLLRVDAALPDDGTGLTITVSTHALF